MPNLQVSIVHSFKVGAMLMFISRSQIRRQDFPFVLAKAVEKGCFLYIHREFLGCCIVVLLLFTFQLSWRNGCLEGLTADRMVACVSTQSLSFIQLLKYKNTKLHNAQIYKYKVEMLHTKDTMEFKQNCFKSAWTFQFF